VRGFFSWVITASKVIALSGFLFLPIVVHAQSCSAAAEAGQVAADSCVTTFAGGTFSTTGAASRPVFFASNGGSITATAPVTLSSVGTTSPGAWAATAGTVSLNSGGSITTIGNTSPGARAEGGAVNLSGTTTSITTSGLNGYGLEAVYAVVGGVNTNGVVNASSVNIVTTGQAAHGAMASRGAIMTLDTIDIQVSGSYASGLIGQGYLPFVPLVPMPTTINGSNVTINVSGDNGRGANVNSTGSITLSDSSLTVTGTNGYGVSAARHDPVNNIGSVMTLLRTSVSCTETAALVYSSGEIYATDSTLTGGKYGVTLTDYTDALSKNPPLNIVSIDGGSLTSVLDTFYAEGPISEITLKNRTAVSADNKVLLNVITTAPLTLVSKVDFTVEDITATGDIIADAGSVLNNALISGSIITGIEKNTHTTIDTSSRWIMNGNSDIHSLALAGTAAFDPAGGYKTLTTKDYVGNDGVLMVNTYLDIDGSPSDRLIINGGSATGTTKIRVNNTGGPGAPTTGNGILVVQAINGATIDPGAFVLDTDLRGIGGHDYALHYGSVDTSGPNNWYLRSTARPQPFPGTVGVPALSPMGLALLAGMLAVPALWRRRRGSL
jgi:hypothetical protein